MSGVAVHAKPKRERGVVNWPGNWRTTVPAGGLTAGGATGDPWGTLSPDWCGPIARGLREPGRRARVRQRHQPTIAGLPAYVTRADEHAAEVPTHRLQRLIDQGPNDNETWSDFIESLLASTLLTGNALAEIETDGRGALSGLRTAPWPQITPWISDAGDLMFDWLPHGAARARRAPPPAAPGRALPQGPLATMA